jgi:hypothetical protein
LQLVAGLAGHKLDWVLDGGVFSRKSDAGSGGEPGWILDPFLEQISGDIQSCYGNHKKQVIFQGEKCHGKK